MPTVLRVYNTHPLQEWSLMAQRDRSPDARESGTLPLALLLISGGAVCFAVALLAPAAARQTVALMGRSGADSASADLADAAAAVIELVAAAVVASGAILWWRAWTGPAAARAGVMVLCGGILWFGATAAVAWTTVWGAPSALRVGPSTWITPAGASLALGAMQLLGATAVVQGIRPGLRLLGARSDTQTEARSAAAALETGTVAGTLVIGSRLFSLILPSLGWSAWTPAVRAVMTISALVLVLTLIWGFVGCWQVARSRQRPSAESAA